jgi:hypothetical protein
MKHSTLSLWLLSKLSSDTWMSTRTPYILISRLHDDEFKPAAHSHILLPILEISDYIPKSYEG